MVFQFNLLSTVTFWELFGVFPTYIAFQTEESLKIVWNIYIYCTLGMWMCVSVQWHRGSRTVKAYWQVFLYYPSSNSWALTPSDEKSSLEGSKEARDGERMRPLSVMESESSSVLHNCVLLTAMCFAPSVTLCCALQKNSPLCAATQGCHTHAMALSRSATVSKSIIMQVIHCLLAGS